MRELSGLPPLTPEVAWVVAALRARYRSSAPDLLPNPPGEVDWRLVLDTARENGVVQLIEPMMRERSADRVPEEVLEACSGEVRDIAIWNLELTRELLHVLDQLESAGIQALPYKGPILAQVAYGDLRLRQFGDLDILVGHRDVERAISLLESDGYRSDAALSPRQVEAVIRYGHDWHLGKRDRFVVEVQWAVANHEHMLPRGIQPLMDRAARVRLAGRDVPTLDPTDQLVVVALHGSIHLFTRLAWVCDMVEAISVPGADPGAALRIADGAHARRMLLFAIAMVDRILHVRPVPELAMLARSDEKLTRVVDDLLPVVLAAGGADYRSPHDRVGIRAALADRRADAAVGLVRTVMTPIPSDYAAVSLPDALFRGYHLVRLARLMRYYAQGRRRVSGVDVFDTI